MARGTTALACSMVPIVLVGAACGRQSAAPITAQPPDAGVSLPGDFGGTGPGTLVTATTLPTVDRRLKGATSIAARITYDSRSGVTNGPSEVTGTVFAPLGAPPESGWPIIAFGHPTTGILPACGPSLSPTLMNLSTTILLLVNAGYVVTLPDFQGLGDDNTYHPYLDATTAGYNLIDSVRAARKLVPDTSDRWVAFGASEGAQGTWAANELAGTYGSGLNLIGSVSISPPLDVTGLADAAESGTLAKSQQAAYLAIVATLGKEVPNLDLDEYRRGIAKDDWDLLLQCEGDSAERSKVIDEITADDLRPATKEATETLRNHLRDSSLPRDPTAAPALVLYGGQDTLIPPLWTDTALARACGMGDVVEIDLQPDKGNDDIDVSGAFPWVADRFKGDPAPNSCDSFTAPEVSDAPADAPAGEPQADDAE